MARSMFATLLLWLPLANAYTLPNNEVLQESDSARPGYKCKCYEGDHCWPSLGEWRTLNASVDGQLQKVTPLADVCYNTFEGMPTYDVEKCAVVTANFQNQDFAVADPVYALNPLYTNDSCLPTTDPTASCNAGYLSDYVIIAKKTKHIAAGVKFARRYNIRLVVRNTGHDFMGRSTAYGALAINTHNFKDVSFSRIYRGPGRYGGSAVTVGAGIQGGELVKKAFEQSPKVTVVTGECATVGFTGGYIQGGGHGPLATIYGMAADQALSFDVITAKGESVTANADENSDLFWALRGGGPATFGIVTAVTVKTFPEVPSAAVIININSTHTTDPEVFWKGVTAFHAQSNHFVDNGMFVYYELLLGSLHIQPIYGPNMNKAKILSVVKPLFDDLAAKGVPYSMTVKDFPTFYELYTDIFEPEGAGNNQLTGGRFMTREDITKNNTAIIEAYKTALSPSAEFPFGIVIGHIVGPGVGAPSVDDAVHPGWRKASSFSITSLFPTKDNWDAAKKLQTDVITKALDEAAPKGGAYVNECDLGQPDWQNQFWGYNYPRLLRTRQKWDPEGIFYAETTVGTEKWSEVGEPPKLCKKI
ncbi:isoamyl alcohol oxidase [Amylocarpus encephaloides]|uniref:Isoamyl alcohol oxidase n=1 Tax=Amylocarpus encephaloides TaxID=45428 RepID=A0A9P8C4N3_9HELO|nr:isoamyl alcohol oxidase [Amylocarpus encephaloides]